jgi:hypothetical protein
MMRAYAVTVDCGFGCPMNTAVVVLDNVLVLNRGDNSHLPNPPFFLDARFAMPLMYFCRVSQRQKSVWQNCS